MLYSLYSFLIFNDNKKNIPKKHGLFLFFLYDKETRGVKAFTCLIIIAIS